MRQKPKIVRFPFQGTVAYQPDCNLDSREIAKKAQQVCDENLKRLGESFKGIRLVVDDGLEGLRYYLVVSRALFEQLKKHNFKEEDDAGRV